MEFIIIARGEKRDSYALYDVANKGVAMASSYTIKQLMDEGHKVIGVKTLKPFSVEFHCKNGEIARKQASISNVSPTKRSLATFVKGIKPTREEKKAIREATTKRKSTLRANKAEKKAAEKAEAKKWVAVQKSKLQILEAGFYEAVGEYDTREEYTTYYASAYSPSALTVLKKLLKSCKFRQHSLSYDGIKEELKNITETFKSYGRVVVCFQVQDYDLPVWGIKHQFGYAPKYFFESEDDYCDTLARVAFYASDDYKPVDRGCHHCSVENAKHGPIACGDGLIADFSNRLRRQPKLCKSTENRIMFDPTRDTSLVDLTYSGFYFA